METSCDKGGEPCAQGHQADVAVSSAVIAVCAGAGPLSRALEVFAQLGRRGLKPEPRAFNALLQGCARSGAREEALQIFHLMRASKVNTWGKYKIVCIEKKDVSSFFHILDFLPR